MSPLKVFVSYAHEDVYYKNELQKHCSLLERSGKIILWTDDDIRAGDNFTEYIRHEINTADMAILLLSSTYWSKEYISNTELPLILEEKNSRDLEIIPLLINGQNKIEFSPLKEQSLVPREHSMLKAIDDFQNKEKAWELIFNEIVRRINDYSKKKQQVNVTAGEMNETYQSDNSRPKVCIYTGSPLNLNIDYNIEKIINIFRKYSIELYHKVLNEDELLDTYDFDLNIVFTQSNGNKIIIEDEFFIKKTISVDDFAESVNSENTIVLLDKEFESTSLHMIKVEPKKITKFLKSYLHQHFKGKMGKSNYHELATSLPYLIDKKNLIHFVGRNTDIENIIKKILTIKNENMILNIKGSGGIGKTAIISKIAIEVAKRGKFKDGIEFIQCEFVKDYDDFENKITFAFSMDNAINFKEQLKEISLGEDRLIILDNVETLLHLIDWEEIKVLIEYISNYATLVITSREKLNEDYEDVYELRALTTDEAEELFTRLYFIKKEDIKILRRKVLEEYLNNSPLAIKLVTKNLPRGKNVESLIKELHENFFDITADDIERIFEEEADLNIERTKSLFHSINYSYNKLADKEKLALEILSLFPDGLYLNDFEKFYKQGVSKPKIDKKNIQSNFVNFSDRDIKSLEDKSLIIINNQYIALQSIIGRFANYKFSQRENEDKIKYYEKAYDYNRFLTRLTSNSQIKSSVIARIFDHNKNNFIKSLEYIHFMKVDSNFYHYLGVLTGNFSMFSSPNKKIILKLIQLKEYFIQESSLALFFETQIILLQYFYGNFENMFSKLKELYPLDKLVETTIEEKEKIAFDLGPMLQIYMLEGFPFQVLKHSLKELTVFDPLFFLLGEYSIALSKKNSKKDTLNDFFDYELALNSNTLDSDMLERYIKNIYKTEHIEKVQTIYTLIKADRSRVKRKDIGKLVVTNPFSSGLKSLMFAMIDMGIEAKENYEKAISNLYHIKYYHVEAILIYSKYLKEISDTDYEVWLKKGKNLAKKHSYRYLLHQYVCMENDEYIEYNEREYPLPEKLDYSRFIKKYNLATSTTKYIS